MRFLIAATLAVALCCLVGCEGGDGGNGSPFVATQRVSEDDLGGAMELHVGETVEIALAENGSTGFQWRCTWDPAAALTLAGDEYVLDGPPMPGAGGTRYFLLRADQAGAVVVTLQYGRWWPGGEVMDPQTLTINVVP